MAIVIVQRAHGRLPTGNGSLSFANPTQAGNSVIVVRIWEATNGLTVLADSDDGGNQYGNYGSGDLNNLSGSGFFTRVEMFQAFNPNGGSPISAALSMQTFTEAFVQGGPLLVDLWMFEVSGLVTTGTSGFSRSAFVPLDGITPPAGSTNPLVPAARGTISSGSREILLIAGVIPLNTSTNVTSVDGPFGLEAVQDGRGCASEIVPASTTYNFQASFRMGASDTYSGFIIALQSPALSTGSIRIVKATVPGGAAQPFTFRPSWGGSFVLHDGQSNDSGALAPGTYSITEDAVANWNTVVTGGDPANIVVTPGSSITLTFTNTFLPPAKGRIIVHKVTDPVGDPQGFTFRPSWGAPFVLGDGQQNDSGPLDAGTYAVTEDPVPGWTTTTSQEPTTIVVVDGSNTDITFTNTKVPICIVQPPETGVMKFARGIGDLNNEMLALECSNEAVAGAWFELHEMVLYARLSAQSRKA